MGACVAITLPLELVLGARVYRRPRRMLHALLVPALLFLAWDAIAIARQVWWFAPRYVSGWRVPFSIPVEEVVFFVVVPTCALLTFEVVSRMLGRPDA
jgi:lycopene cyclase domain-containing protein